VSRTQTGAALAVREGEPDPGETPGDGPRPSDSRKMVGGRDLPLAIAVGLVLAGIFLGSLFWHPIAFSLLVALLVALACVESGRVLRSVGVHLEVPVLLVASLVTMFGAYRAGHAGQAVGVVVLFLGGVLWQLGDANRRDVVRRLATTVMFGLWIGFLASFAVLLITRAQDAAIVTLGVIGAAVFSDIGAYAFGVAIGRHRIAPSISPNKTWEGFLGGLVVATVLAVLVLPNVGEVFDVTSAALLAVLCGSAAFLGDLVESMIKRDLGVKDLGDLLPGHGGVLDRVDGILFALPVGYYAVEVLTRA
jgi:phosphatidate cytidylyltransferase